MASVILGRGSWAYPAVIPITARSRLTDVPGALVTRNRGINARGDIIGNYDDSSGNTHGFEATE